jgi:hypothetical protein
MKLFLGFLIISFVAGIALWKKRLQLRLLLLAGLCCFVCFAYFSLNQI